MRGVSAGSGWRLGRPALPQWHLLRGKPRAAADYRIGGARRCRTGAAGTASFVCLIDTREVEPVRADGCRRCAGSVQAANWMRANRGATRRARGRKGWLAFRRSFCRAGSASVTRSTAQVRRIHIARDDDIHSRIDGMDAPDGRRQECHKGTDGALVQSTKEATVRNAGIVGIDLAKRRFKLRGATAEGGPVFCKRLSPGKLLKFLSEQPPAGS